MNKNKKNSIIVNKQYILGDSSSAEYEEWKKKLESLPFLEQANMLKNKILESDELSPNDRAYFQDCFDYVCSLFKKNKPLDCNLLKIHMGLKGHDKEPQKIEQFIRTLMLLSLCGFQFDYAGSGF